MNENLDAFLSHFGVPCLADSVAFMGLLDQPDELQQLTRVGAHSRQYELTYRSDAATLMRDQAVLIRDLPHQVREAPRQIGDGAFSRVLLSRT
jgi:hypothetical protein